MSKPIDVLDTAIQIFFGDKLAAAKQREIRETVIAVHEGKMTADEAVQQLRFKDGDALDQALGKVNA